MNFKPIMAPSNRPLTRFERKLQNEYKKQVSEQFDAWMEEIEMRRKSPVSWQAFINSLRIEATIDCEVA